MSFFLDFVIYSIMSMLDEIDKLMNITDTSLNYRTINLGGKMFYIEGIKSVISFGEDEMCFQLKKAMLVISGSSLRVKYLDKTTCVVEGNIVSAVIK